MTRKVLVVGICGSTCSGKTTLAQQLSKVISNSDVFGQDDYYYPDTDDRHTWIPELNHINFDILGSLDMERMVKDIKEHIHKLTITPQNGTLKHVVFIEGFCIFNYKPLVELCDLKYYLTLGYEECHKRRLTRVYEPPDCPGYFEHCAWPEHLKLLQEVRDSVGGVVFLDGKVFGHVDKILKDIAEVDRHFCTLK